MSQTPRTNRLVGFGPNEWLVDEIYQKYVEDKDSVDPVWREFFGETNGNGSSPVPESPPATEQAPTAAPTLTAPLESRVPSPQAPTKATAPVTSPTTAPAPTPAATPSPSSTGPNAPTPAQPAAASAAPAAPAEAKDETVALKGPAARVVTNMEASLAVPTATSVRVVPAKLLVDNRTVINKQLRRGRGGKVSFTHLIGYAVVRALRAMPEMNYAFTDATGKPAVIEHQHVNLGLAIDLAKPDGSRQLLVPCIKRADTMEFSDFWAAYEDTVRRARNNKLTVDDFAGTTISLTNPGTIGTVHSVPRLMAGQGTIVGVGAMEYPAEYSGTSQETLARLAVSKVLTLTSTYDHRIIQGAQSGDFLRVLHGLLLGEDGFYDDVFRSLRIPYEPIRWVPDTNLSREDVVNRGARVQELIHAYRVRGHLLADTDPLEYRVRSHQDLDLGTHGLTLWDLDREFATGGFAGTRMATLREILDLLRDAYCRTVGIEYMHIQDPEEREWIQERIERPHEKPDRTEQLRILRRLNAAEAFETFLQTKFVGQRRFSLEGGEAAIPLLDEIISDAADAGLDEVCVGMPHRGRLNVLANLAGKSYAQIFREFEGNLDPSSVQGSGDVKYHLGTRGTFTAESGTQIPVYLAANPSHLEAVDSVLEGIARAKQDTIDKGDAGFTVLPLLMHGDAAFAGQGVVAETLNLSQLRGYRTGGTIHLVVNNQVGFTTSPESSRSSVYATDVARMIQAPILHVNGDDPEACIFVAQLAFEFRQTFKRDIVIDMICYRRRGHNETDDPSMTQPLMYDLIDAKRSVRKLYTEALVGRGDITIEEAEQALRDYQEQLEKVFRETREATTGGGVRAPKIPVHEPKTVAAYVSAIDDELVKRIVETQTTLPAGFTPHPRLLPQLQRRAQMVADGTIDWAMAETLAIGSLLAQGRSVRLAGQDSRRGTFGQRHAVIFDRVTGQGYKPLKNLYADGSKFYVYDSLLSEFAAMGFEYGYSVARPDALVMWEAQFGDFANGAQTIIDEFISSGEQKWNQKSGVVLLLPHGYEGQGPDHSSARIERFLTLCAQNNMTVSQPSTPASYFHLLRRHTLGAEHRPLVVFTPKSMLRLKAAASPTEQFTAGEFTPVITDPLVEASKVRRVVLCAGKIAHELIAARADRGVDDIAILRLEQFYPLPTAEIAQALSAFRTDAEVMWVQDEPANQGAAPFILLNLPEALGGRAVTRATRPASSSPAVGQHSVHDREQKAVVDQALGI